MSGPAARSEPDVLAGRYVLERLLGEGGMSRVFLARDRELDRTVAVKLLLRGAGEGADPDDLARLRDEARAAAGIDHPGVVTVHDVGESTAGLYVVMSYVPGETLAGRIDRAGPLPPEEVVRIGCAVCDALGAAHRAGVVHRDVSPGNIVLGPDGDVTVTDFGIARIGPGAGRTQTGHVIGTPSYLAPEQGRSTGELDGRADLYALGCCLFAALTGRPPFTDPDAFAVVLAHLRDTPPRPSSLRAGIPTALEEVLLRTLAKDPDLRPPDAAALATQLTAGLGTTPAPAGPPRTRELPAEQTGQHTGERTDSHAAGDAPSLRPLRDEPGRSAPPGRDAGAARSTGSHALDSTLADVEHDDARSADRRRAIGVALIVLAALLAVGAAAALLLLG
ncbi:serine/threonine-protein kinase [Pseudonocardia nantongensis]|uniref:serine/threonine-protein kinase n=1 Tax=Pseudonocardia nantongensis TaxID=1181885 RepID=UPI00397C2C13